jgi:hypothetical protein
LCGPTRSSAVNRGYSTIASCIASSP